MGATFLITLTLLAQGVGGGSAGTDQPSAAAQQRWRSDLPPILLAQADPAAEKPAEQPAEEPAGKAAEKDAPAGKAAGKEDAKQGQKRESAPWTAMLWPMVAIGFIFYFLLIRPQRKDQAKRQSMLAGVKKNDRIVTIGGIYGVVTNVHREADEVTIKVDESNNTKLRVTLGSIARILGDESSGEASSNK